MRKLLAAAIAATLASGIGIATAQSAATQAAAPQAQFTCMYFQNPTVELVWSHVCRF